MTEDANPSIQASAGLSRQHLMRIAAELTKAGEPVVDDERTWYRPILTGFWHRFRVAVVNLGDGVSRVYLGEDSWIGYSDFRRRDGGRESVSDSGPGAPHVLRVESISERLHASLDGVGIILDEQPHMVAYNRLVDKGEVWSVSTETPCGDPIFYVTPKGDAAPSDWLPTSGDDPVAPEDTRVVTKLEILTDDEDMIRDLIRHADCRSNVIGSKILGPGGDYDAICEDRTP